LVSAISYINIGYRNKLREVKIPVSKLNHHILQALYQGGLISSFSIDFLNPSKYCVILQLEPNPVNKFLALKRVSRPAARYYAKSSFLTRYKSPFFILSTTRGIITPFDLLGRNYNMGGELLYILKNK